ncbi:MAG: hypothetical protein V4582_21850 [Pseudomonadota bacterium]
MDNVIKESVLAVARRGHTRAESTGFFRVALGLYYLAGLMTDETLDFKRIDSDFNRFIYQGIGKGHSIASVLQFMSGDKVVHVIESKRFLAAFTELCPQVPVELIPFLLSLNLGVAKNISGLGVEGALADWIERQKEASLPESLPESPPADAPDVL